MKANRTLTPLTPWRLGYFLDQQGTNVFSKYNTTVLDDSWLGKRYRLVYKVIVIQVTYIFPN